MRTDSSTPYRRRPRQAFRPLAAAAAALCAALLGGCAGPSYLSGDSLDQGHDAVSRSISDFVDRADHLFGEPRIEDRLRTVKVATGPAMDFASGGHRTFNQSLSARIPLPSLERKANLFLDVGSDVEAETEKEAIPTSDFRKSYQAGLSYLSFARVLSPGITLRGRWEDGPQGTLTPFVRWEKKADPFRIFLSQNVSYDSLDKLGEDSTVYMDYVVGDQAFVRLLTDASARQDVAGLDMKHALIFRQLLSADAALSHELGLLYNTTSGTDGDIYAQIQWIFRAGKPWIEWELTPRIQAPQDRHLPLEYDFTISVRVIFEEFMHHD